MGKHSGSDDSTVHPLVAAALPRRAGDPAGAHDQRTGSSTGWPEPEREGEGAVGWPDDTVAMLPVDARDGEADRAPTCVVKAVPLAPVASRRGWRRLFGASPAA